MTFLAHAAGTDESLSLVMLFGGIWAGWIGWSRLRGKGFERMPTWGAYGMIAGAAVLVIAATFVPRMLLGPKTTSVASGPRPSSTATLSFLDPTHDLQTNADQLTVRLDLQGATLTQTTSTSVSPNTGHIHLSLDGTLISMSGDTTQVIDLRNLTPGKHILTAEFVANDHLSFAPPVVAQVSFVKEAST
jgi:hypothetical protein